MDVKVQIVRLGHSMISTTAEYALRAVVAIGQHGGNAVVTPTIAEITKVPPGYLAKVLQALRKAGLVISKRGLGGGFTLAMPAEEMTVLAVVLAMEPTRRILRCPLGIDTHGSGLCPLHKRLDDETKSVEQSFASTTIAELLSVSGRCTPLCQSKV